MKQINVPLSVILSFRTGIFYCEFSELHSYIEKLCGHSVWTHQIPRVSKKLQTHIKKYTKVLDSLVIPPYSKDTFNIWLKQQTKQFGEYLEIPILPDSSFINPIF